jgi:MFS family permease
MAAVGDAVRPEVRGVALGVAMLVFLVGGGVGSAVVGGLAELLGIRGSLLLLTLLPLAGVAIVLPRRSRTSSRTTD